MRGGIREGAGRKPGPSGVKRNVLFRLSPETIAQIEALAQRWDVPKVAVLERAIREAVES